MHITFLRTFSYIELIHFEKLSESIKHFSFSLVGAPYLSENAILHYRKVVNTSLKMKCPVVGDPQPAVAWYKNGKSLPLDMASALSETRLIVQNQLLKFSRLFFSDAGNYSCRASNGEGRLNTTITLTVLGKLESPQYLDLVHSVC